MGTDLEKALYRLFLGGKPKTSVYLGRAFFSGFIGIAAYFAALSLTRNKPAGIFIAFTAAAVCLLTGDVIGRLEYRQFSEKKMNVVEAAVFQRKLLLLPKPLFLRECEEALPSENVRKLAVIQNVSPAAEDEVFAELREQGANAASVHNGLSIVSVSGFSAGAEELAEKLGDDMLKLIPAESIPALRERHRVTREEAEAELLSEAVRLRRKPACIPLRSLLEKGKESRFLLLSAVLFILSFIFRYGLYLRIVAAAALIFGAFPILRSALRRRP